MCDFKSLKYSKYKHSLEYIYLFIFLINYQKSLTRKKKRSLKFIIFFNSSLKIKEDIDMCVWERSNAGVEWETPARGCFVYFMKIEKKIERNRKSRKDIFQSL